MSTEQQPVEAAKAKAAEKPFQVLLRQREAMTSRYRQLIKPTGGLLTESMTYAYNKAILDCVNKLIEQENKNEEPLQKE